MTSMTQQLTPVQAADLLTRLAEVIPQNAHLIGLDFSTNTGAMVQVHDGPSFLHLVDDLDLTVDTTRTDGMAYARGHFGGHPVTVVCGAHAVMAAGLVAS